MTRTGKYYSYILLCTFELSFYFLRLKLILFLCVLERIRLDYVPTPILSGQLGSYWYRYSLKVELRRVFQAFGPLWSPFLSFWTEFRLNRCYLIKHKAWGILKYLLQYYVFKDEQLNATDFSFFSRLKIENKA